MTSAGLRLCLLQGGMLPLYLHSVFALQYPGASTLQGKIQRPWVRMEGECRAKQVADELGSTGKASQDQLWPILRERRSLRGMAAAGILLGIFS